MSTMSSVQMRTEIHCPACQFYLYAVSPPYPNSGSVAVLKCLHPECPHPDGLQEMLTSPGFAEPAKHKAFLHEDGWSVTHPLIERITGEILTCPIHSVAGEARERELPLGVYEITGGVTDFDNWVLVPSEEPQEGQWPDAR